MNEDNSIEYKVKSLPTGPGVYQFLDKHGIVIYVGKAKNLRNRVSSYFRPLNQVGKTKLLVKHINDLLHISVETEQDALLLENKLIKKFQPKYNILLKDDKTYPWICISNEAYPRVFFTRSKLSDGSFYYGPFTSVNSMHELLGMFRKMFKLRTCRTVLSQEDISKGKYDICLDYHIKNCCGPCIGDVAPGEYNSYIDNIKSILNGRIADVIKQIASCMRSLADSYRFEDAQKLKDRLDTLLNYRAKNIVSVKVVNTVEVYSILEDKTDGFWYVNFMKITDSILIRSYTKEIVSRLEETPADILATAIADMHFGELNIGAAAREIIIPFEIEFSIDDIKLSLPKSGYRKQLMSWSVNNCELFMHEQHRMRSLVDPDKSVNNLMKTMQSDLQMSVEPRHIECFDNSNLQGTNAVSSCVVFRDGKPSKKDYRLFNVKTVEGPDDFATMREVISRRYSRLLKENQHLPQLIIVDGGKGQLRCAEEELKKIGVFHKVTLIGIAKRLEEIFFPGDNVPLYLDKNSVTLKVIQHLRDEAHRFGITFHRNKRSKQMIKSSIDNIPGVGEKTKEKLLKYFGSVKKISQAPVLELKQVVDINKACAIFDFFHGSDNKDE